MTRTTRVESAPANADPPMPTPSSALETASSTIRFRHFRTRTSGYCTTATIRAFMASSQPQVPYGTSRYPVMYTE